VRCQKENRSCGGVNFEQELRRRENQERENKSSPAGDAAAHTSRDRTHLSRLSRNRARNREQRRDRARLATQGRPLPETESRTNEIKARRHAARGKRRRNGSAEPLCTEKKTTTAAMGSLREAGLARRAYGRKLSEPKRNEGEKKRGQRKNRCKKDTATTVAARCVRESGPKIDSTEP
jgi:hypothetical protein